MIELREHQPEEKELWIEYVTHPYVFKWMSSKLKADPEAFFDDCVANPAFKGIWADGHLVGQLKLENHNKSKVRGVYYLGYWIAEPCHGNGFASAAVAKALPPLFGPGMKNSVRANTYQGNEASMAVLRKFGFRATNSPGPQKFTATNLNCFVLTQKLWDSRAKKRQP